MNGLDVTDYLFLLVITIYILVKLQQILNILIQISDKL